MPKSGIWVSNVRQHGNRWRFSVGSGAGSLKWYSYPTEVEAQSERTKALAAEERRRNNAAKATLDSALAGYRTYYADRGNKPLSVDREIRRIVQFWRRETGSLSLSPEGAQRLYSDLRVRPCRRTGEPLSVAEQHGTVKAARRFGRWLIRQGLWRENPLGDLELIGRPKRGEESKLQLTVDQARQWMEAAMRLAYLGDQPALAALLCLRLGLRASEAAQRRCSDLDADGTELWIRRSKTVAGRRRVKVGELREALLQQRDRAREWGRRQDVPQLDPPLFPPVAYDAGGKAVVGETLSRFAVRRAVHRVSKEAGLPLVCPHGLRGTFASITAEAGVPLDILAQAMGHSSTTVTTTHYTTPDAAAAGAAERAQAVLKGSR